MHNTNIDNVCAQTCPGLQIQIIRILLCSRVCPNTHMHSQIHKHMLPYTIHSYLHTRTSTHTHPINPMCVHIGVYQYTHALPPSLSHTHIHRPTASPLLSVVPHQPPVLLPPGAPPAVLPPSQALLRPLLPNAEAACHPTQEQTAGNVSTLHTQPASNAAKRPCAPACCPFANQPCVFFC